MALKKKIKKVEVKKEEPKIQEEITVGKLNASVATVGRPVQEEEPKIQEEKPKIIKKGSKILVSGRTFGNSKLECPIGSVKDYSTKIKEIENGNYLIDKGWISPKSVK